MTQEDKDLVLRDLCARLPYGVKFKWCDNFHTDYYYTLIGINEGQIIGRNVNQEECLFFRGEDIIKPYLRPMSSMTKEEQKEYHKTFRAEVYGRGFVYVESIRSFDWLNKKMFDYRGLISKGRAISTEKFNPYYEKL